ncbi:DUF4352 domain-containing protein [Listeria booriae]|uniref:DUF4352 domain-containing protein n=1 Tax=Listeria booriae TaxID=1552123 RepID=A0A7X1D6Z8_9LIST|nr:DUF4352 domain-containing protein [Listeria booriae]MBC2175060.1 DUF4352 domain-containing protein [Listeria booriae]
MKKIIMAIAASGMLILGGCVTQEKADNKQEKQATQKKEPTNTKNFMIALDQAVYTDERSPGEAKHDKILRLKLTVKNNAIESDTFDSTKLKITDKNGKTLRVYPYDNMIENLDKGETKTGYAYFVATGDQPYQMTYTNRIKESFQWNIPTVK